MYHQHPDLIIISVDCSYPDILTPHPAMYADHIIAVLVHQFAGIPVTIKGNAIFRYGGFTTIKKLADAGFKVFLDFNLFQTVAEFTHELTWLKQIPNLSILTISEHSHKEVFSLAHSALPNTLIVPTHTLEDLHDEHFQYRFNTTRAEAVKRFFGRVEQLPTQGIICSPTDITFAHTGFFSNKTLLMHVDDEALSGKPTIQQAVALGAQKLIIEHHQKHLPDRIHDLLSTLDSCYA